MRREGGREGGKVRREGGREGDCMKTVHAQEINVRTRTHFSFDLTVVVSTSLARSTQMICKVGQRLLAPQGGREVISSPRTQALY